MPSGIAAAEVKTLHARPFTQHLSLPISLNTHQIYYSSYNWCFNDQSHHYCRFGD